MAVTLSFTFGPICAGGNHSSVAATLNFNGTIKTMTWPIQKPDLLVQLSAGEYQDCAEVLLRIMVRQLLGTDTAAQIAAAIQAKTIDLTVSG